MMVKAGRITINPRYVAGMSWENTHYVNSSGRSVLTVRMHDGHEYRIEHTVQYMDGVDAYAVEKAIINATEEAG
jgi:hypothetical protein